LSDFELGIVILALLLAAVALAIWVIINGHKLKKGLE
jgi:hypothetical protein